MGSRLFGVSAFVLAQVQELTLARLKENISCYGKAYIGKLLEILVGLKLPKHLLVGRETKILILDLHQFVQVILQLAMPQLVEIICAQNHVLNQLSDFLMEFYHIWLSVHEVLDCSPILEECVVVGLLGASSEWVHHFAEHLCRCESRALWLLDPEYVPIDVQSDFSESCYHITSNLFSCYGLLALRLRLQGLSTCGCFKAWSLYLMHSSSALALCKNGTFRQHCGTWWPQCAARSSWFLESCRSSADSSARDLAFIPVHFVGQPILAGAPGLLVARCAGRSL